MEKICFDANKNEKNKRELD